MKLHLSIPNLTLFQGRVTGLRKNVQPYDNIRTEKVSSYFQLILWSWGFVTLCTDRVTSRPPQKKLDLVGNKPPLPLHFFLSEVVSWFNVWVCCALGNVSLCQMTAMISRLNPDLPWLEYINSLLADYDVQVKTKTALNVVVCLLSIALLKSFRSYLVVFKLVVLL